MIHDTATSIGYGGDWAPPVLATAGTGVGTGVISCSSSVYVRAMKAGADNCSTAAGNKCSRKEEIVYTRDR